MTESNAIVLREISFYPELQLELDNFDNSFDGTYPWSVANANFSKNCVKYKTVVKNSVYQLAKQTNDYGIE